MLRSKGRTCQAEGPASGQVAQSLFYSRRRTMELLKQGPVLEGSHRLASGVWCKVSVEFLISLSYIDTCQLMTELLCNSLVSDKIQTKLIILSCEVI
jgi:hypothetical protein